MPKEKQSQPGKPRSLYAGVEVRRKSRFVTGHMLRRTFKHKKKKSFADNWDVVLKVSGTESFWD
jgi:hypothetical protein